MSSPDITRYLVTLALSHLWAVALALIIQFILRRLIKSQPELFCYAGAVAIAVFNLSLLHIFSVPWILGSNLLLLLITWVQARQSGIYFVESLACVYCQWLVMPLAFLPMTGLMAFSMKSVALVPSRGIDSAAFAVISWWVVYGVTNLACAFAAPWFIHVLNALSRAARSRSWQPIYMDRE